MTTSTFKKTLVGHHEKASSPGSYLVKIHTRLCTFFLCLGTAGLLLASCGTEKSEYQFKNAMEGIACYREFVRELKNTRSNDMAVIASDIAAWQEMEDSVEAVLRRDTAAASNPHFFPETVVAGLHDTALEELMNRAVAQPRTLEDLLTLRMGANRLAGDEKIAKAADAAAPFFQSLDNVSIYNMDCGSLADRYHAYLQSVEKSGIHNKEELLMFMSEEDRLFRSFVTHLWEMDGRSATDITRTTERVYAQLSRRGADSVISDDDLYILLTMRANRRLLANAQACLLDIKAGRVRTDDQRRAYRWMILQPFTTISDTGLAMLTDAQKATFAGMAKEASTALVRLAGQSRDERTQMARLPDLMVKIYISSL